MTVLFPAFSLVADLVDVLVDDIVDDLVDELIFTTAGRTGRVGSCGDHWV